MRLRKARPLPLYGYYRFVAGERVLRVDETFADGEHYTAVASELEPPRESPTADEVEGSSLSLWEMIQTGEMDGPEFPMRWDESSLMSSTLNTRDSNLLCHHLYLEYGVSQFRTL